MSSATRRICFDIDNVIAQTDEVMRKVISDYTGGRVQLAYADVKEFNYYECEDKNGNRITKEEWKQVHGLFSEPRYLWQIQPMPGAIEGLHLLAKSATLHLATSRLRKARRATVEWLEEHGFPDHDLHFVKHSEKHASLGSFVAAVEDHYEEGVHFARRNITCFLLRHPWNESKPQIHGIQWVATWPALTERLIAIAAGA
jgi:uncharacterized HAD superfamily protein